ncbi:hypothetical protein HHK36_024128 [Tetracentron sinense]|uniref:BHLH domain-containing protein n=1 Tax=Tetracentron sinense TaxID=13715 RepID=A0A834YIG4_TETSI|nr:hypothetical protein HHK36_024128 [Tetracentron sinense]
MAEEGSESSAATSSSTPNWWELPSNSLSSWNHTTPWHPPNPNSNSSCEEEISMSTSFTNASNQSGLTVDSSRQLVEPASSNQLMGEPAAENHLWSHVFINVGNSGDLQSSQGVGENFLEALSSKNLSAGMFEPACDYLKKMDSCWEFTSSASFNSLEKQLNGFNGSLIENERLTNLSNLVSNWSIAPPDPELDSQINPPTRNVSLNSSMDQYSGPDLSHSKQNPMNPSSYGLEENRNSGLMPCYGHDVKVESQHQEIEVSEASFQSSFNRNGVGYQMSRNSSAIGDNRKYFYGMPDAPWSNTRNFSDLISFTGCLSKPPVDFQTTKPPVTLRDQSKKQGHHTSSSTRGNGRTPGITSEGKKKRSEDTSETLLKKPKHETVSSVKVQGPKVKLGDRITALQQIVSPFGKTDTASVLLEAIQYIKFLQEQVQDPCGGFERKDKAEAKFDLKSRGLCLVPISCTPQVYRENPGTDYWTPTYRGCLYR